MSNSFSVTFSYQMTSDTPAPGGGTGHYLEFTVTSALGPNTTPTDTNIFLYQRELVAVNTGTYASFFSNVCTPADMQEVTTTAEPLASANTPLLFRLNYVKAYFRSQVEMQQTLQELLADIDNLMNSLRLRYTHLQGPVTGTITSSEL